uniref:Uncharacterized protein n=1 Tax=Nelumbo nucifera TaxID=4432 RepID=A0A822XNX4_NELNU|nr:TPA_asm: hypothetical protein HUJ06_023460 [Nelumbo nucifera]
MKRKFNCINQQHDRISSRRKFNDYGYADEDFCDLVSVRMNRLDYHLAAKPMMNESHKSVIQHMAKLSLNSLISLGRRLFSVAATKENDGSHHLQWFMLPGKSQIMVLLELKLLHSRPRTSG